MYTFFIHVSSARSVASGNAGLFCNLENSFVAFVPVARITEYNGVRSY